MQYSGGIAQQSWFHSQSLQNGVSLSAFFPLSLYVAFPLDLPHTGDPAPLAPTHTPLRRACAKPSARFDDLAPRLPRFTSMAPFDRGWGRCSRSASGKKKTGAPSWHEFHRPPTASRGPALQSCGNLIWCNLWGGGGRSDCRLVMKTLCR